MIRENELTEVVNRNIFDEAPFGCTAPKQLKRWIDFRVAYHSAQQLNHPRRFPLQLDFELNSTCQLKCSFCRHGNERVAKNLLPIELFQKAIDEGEQYGLCSIKLNGINEPLLVRTLEQHIKYARSRGVLNTYMATNGLLLNERRAEALVDAGLSKLMISLDAMTAETFFAMRRSEKLAEIVENIHGLLRVKKRLKVKHPLIRVNFVKTKNNAHEADAFVRHWSKLVDSVGFQQQVGVPGAGDKTLRHSEDFKCAFPFKQLVIANTGDILPCCTFSGSKLPIGNIRDMTLADAWRAAKIRKLRATHKRGLYRENPVCKECVEGC